MPFIYLDCPTCNAENKIDDSLVGSKTTCLKCKSVFTVEVGGSYDLAPPQRRARPTRNPAASQSSDSDDEQKKIDPGLEKMLEQWPEE